MFARYEKVILLLLGFLLTTIGGGLLGNYLQTRSRFKAQQEVVFAEVAQRLDRRTHETRLLLYALNGDSTYGAISTRWPLYIEMLEDWNANGNRSSALVQRYFGRQAGRCFRTIHENFVNIGYSVRRTVDPDSIFPDLERLHRDAGKFDYFLLERMSAGVFVRPPPCIVAVVQRRDGPRVDSRLPGLPPFAGPP